jgi:hypothetical protein
MDAAGPARPVTVALDDGSIVLGWLARLTITLTLLGIVGFEVLSIVVARVSIQNYGQEAAQAAITSYQQYHDPALAYAAAQVVADQNGAKIARRSFRMAPDGAVSFDISNTATTLVLYRVDRLASLADVETTIYEEPFEQAGQQP